MIARKENTYNGRSKIYVKKIYDYCGKNIVQSNKKIKNGRILNGKLWYVPICDKRILINKVLKFIYPVSS